MCGITGFMATDKARGQYDLTSVIEHMTASLLHRGPDDHGTWSDKSHGVHMGHRRLSIQDLSLAGHQPMRSRSGQFIISYNGEIYNAPQLRDRLKGMNHQFEGTSDTEVILTAFSEWGIESSLPMLDGIFAFAAWDLKTQTLCLARDRVGLKPVYYGWSSDGSFIFGSELKALRCFPSFSNAINHNALSLFMRNEYIAAPHSIYENAFKLPPGHFLTLKSGSFTQGSEVLSKYWALDTEWMKAAQTSWTGTESEAIDHLDDIITDAVKKRLLADVPVGSLLSGGIDSSLIAAVFQKVSCQPAKTYTIGFHEKQFDEAPAARAIASHIQSEHVEMYVSSEEALSIIPSLPLTWDEPFSDLSQLPTQIVFSMASKDTKVLLSGDGGDELFAGYNRYFAIPNKWSRYKLIPPILRTASAKGLRTLSERLWQMEHRTRFKLPVRSLNQAAKLITKTNFSEFYCQDLTAYCPPSSILKNEWTDQNSSNRSINNIDVLDIYSQMGLIDACSYLPDDILVKLDRASMASSVEGRVPLLDPKVISFAAGLPANMKVRGGSGKYILRKLLNRYIPESMMSDRKMGFGVPMAEWLRGPLKTWACDLLSMDTLKQQGFFEPETVNSILKEHLTGQRDYHFLLWSILCFQSWHKEWL